MTGYDIDKILGVLEAKMNGQDLSDTLNAFPGDKYLCSSTMQKAIRRGETQTALKAAMGLWQQDRRSFWRRVHIISLEDVGVASSDIIETVLTVHENPSWRKRMGDLRVGLFLVKIMSEAVKIRLGDQLYSIIDRGPECKALRQSLPMESDQTLANNVLNKKASVELRLLSLWLLAGTKKFPSDYMPTRQGSPEMAVEVLRGLDVPGGFRESCIAVMNKTQWPLALHAPILWQEVWKQKSSHSIREEIFSPSPEVEGIPLYGLDQFTRIGKSCLRALQKEIPDLKLFTPSQLGLTLFYLEGEKTDRTLTSPELEEFRRAGEFADIESSGLCIPEYLGLKECMASHFNLLDEIRKDRLARYLDGDGE